MGLYPVEASALVTVLMKEAYPYTEDRTPFWYLDVRLGNREWNSCIPSTPFSVS